MICEKVQTIINSVTSEKPIRNKYLLASAVKHVHTCHSCQDWVNLTYKIKSTIHLKEHVGITDLFTTPQEEKAFDLYLKYTQNQQLMDLEHRGFVEGLRRGKTDNVSLQTLFWSLKKQYYDWLNVNVDSTTKNVPEMKKALADLRNVAAIVFFKLCEGEGKKCQKIL